MAEITLTPDRAKAVFEEARQDKVGEGPVYPGAIPESPDKMVEVATELVGFAIDAYINDNMRGREVTDILGAAGVTVSEDGTISVNGNGTTAAVDAPPAPETETEPASAPPAQPPKPPAPPATAEPEDQVVLIGPDGTTRVSIPEAQAAALEAAGFTREAPPEPEPEPELPANLTIVIGGAQLTLPYEQAKPLLDSGQATLPDEDPPKDNLGGTPPSQPEEDQEPQQEPPAEDAYAGQELEEPWEGYNSMKDTEIRAMMEDFTDEQIEYVKAYEGRHKKRQRIGAFKKKVQKAAAPKDADAAGDNPAPSHETLDEQADAAIAADPDPEPAADPTPTPVPDDSPDPDHIPILTAHDERLLALAEVEKARLPIPNEQIASPPEFPEDIAGVDDKTLATLHSQFNACLALANWKLGMVIVDERAFKHIADYHAREARKNLDPVNPATGKHKGQDLLDREAEDDEQVRIWREKQFNAEIRAIPLRKLVDIYSSHVEVLSRQWTFRDREYASSGGVSRRSAQPPADQS